MAQKLKPAACTGRAALLLCDKTLRLVQAVKLCIEQWQLSRTLKQWRVPICSLTCPACCSRAALLVR